MDTQKLLRKISIKNYFNSKCRYCGTEYNKQYRTQKYCSTDCKHKALQDQKASYQRKRRKLHRDGFLVTNEMNHSNYLGTNYLSAHRRNEYHVEAGMIQKEMRRLGLR